MTEGEHPVLYTVTSILLAIQRELDRCLDIELSAELAREINYVGLARRILRRALSVGWDLGNKSLSSVAAASLWFAWMIEQQPGPRLTQVVLARLANTSTTTIQSRISTATGELWHYLDRGEKALIGKSRARDVFVAR